VIIITTSTKTPVVRINKVSNLETIALAEQKQAINDKLEAIKVKFELTAADFSMLLRVAVEDWQMKGLEEEANLRNSFGDNVELLSQQQIQSRIKSPIYKGALWDPDGTALVDPARLVWGLERACISLGVKIFENSHVDRLERTKNGMIVHTPYGSVYATKVALATNVFKSLIKRAHKYVVPVYDFQLVTEPLSAGAA